MKEGPEYKSAPEKEEKKGENLYKPETAPDYYGGGATEEKAKQMDEESAAATSVKKEIADVKDSIENKMSEVLSPKDIEEEKPLDISFLKNKIQELEEKKNTQNWFKKQFGSTEEVSRRLKMGLRKIEDPKFKGMFAEQFKNAYDQGGEKLAMEYAESIGNGELVYPKDGVLMAKSSQDSYFPQ